MAHEHTILLLGASRGLGLGLVREYLGLGWHVVATARDPHKATELTALAEKHAAQVRVEALDVAVAGAGQALAQKLAGTVADVVFVVAGQHSQNGVAIHDVAADAAAAEFVTNAWAPPTVAEALSGVIRPGGTYVFMTSRLGSLTLTSGAPELYSASKAALNMLGIAFSKRHPEETVVLMHPGWVRTDMGGRNAPLDVPTSAKGMLETIAALAGKAGVHYVDYQGKTLPW
jgi:NAD(P)-dependent dehydrogenase (short-subunit alcohol dehydrogenase family)